MRFENFDLLISDPSVARVIDSPGGGKSEPVPLTVDTEGFVERYERLITHASLSEDVLKSFGAELFQTLVCEDVLALFYESVGIARGADAGLCLRLHLESASLSRLPWELLFTRREGFLATNPLFSLCRYRPIAQPSKTLPVELPLRILVLVSAPEDLPLLDHVAERRALETALETMLATQGVALQFEMEAHRERLLTHLQNEPVHVMHFIGHGGWEEDHGVILLEGEDGQADPVDAQTFAGILSASNSLRLVTLNACATAFESARRGFAGVASQLVGHGLPAVIAMRNVIQDRVAIAFAKHLYGNLAGGESVDVAMTRARQQLRLERGASPGVFATPILYLHAPDGLIFEVIGTRQKRLVRVAQQMVQLAETSEALAEWKELHEILHMLNQSLDLVGQMAGNPLGADLIPSIWAQFRQSLDGLLLPFAAERMRFIGVRYQETEGGRSGEEWSVRTVEIAAQIDQAILDRKLVLLKEQIGSMRGLLLRYLSLCNRKMVELLGVVGEIYTGAKTILDNLRAEEVSSGLVGLNWEAITEDLSALDDRNGRISEWIRLHDLFDRLHVQFATIVASAATASTLDMVADAWTRLRDTLVFDLLDQARQIAFIGKAYAQGEDGSLLGELWAIEIKRKSDQLDGAIQARDLERSRQIIIELDRAIKKHYLQVNRSVKDEMFDFTKRSFALQARVTPWQ